jgi:hypothetical protein
MKKEKNTYPDREEIYLVDRLQVGIVLQICGVSLLRDLITNVRIKDSAWAVIRTSSVLLILVSFPSLCCFSLCVKKQTAVGSTVFGTIRVPFGVLALAPTKCLEAHLHADIAPRRWDHRRKLSMDNAF